MCLHWLAQCFWNYLDWTEVCHYLCCCVLLGADYQVYTCVAAFKHLQPEILQHTQTQELQLFLKVSPSWSTTRLVQLEGGGASHAPRMSIGSFGGLEGGEAPRQEGAQKARFQLLSRTA